MSEFARFYAAQRAAKLCACRWEEKSGALTLIMGVLPIGTIFPDLDRPGGFTWRSLLPGARITPRPAADLAKAKEALLFAVEESFAAMTHPLLPGWRPLADAEKAGR